jgi:hypothetical protein
MKQAAVPLNGSSFLFMLLVVVFLQACHKDSLPNPEVRTAIDLDLIYGDDTHKTVTPKMTIYLNGIPVDVVFDSGSSGLRVIAGAVSGGKFETENVPVSLSYGDMIHHTHVNGIVAGGDFSLQKGGPSVPLRFMLINSVQIDSAAPVNTQLAPTSNAGVFRHLNAIMGVGTRLNNTNNGIASPLAQWPGGGRFIIELPTYGGTKAQVILNPNSHDLQGFEAISLHQGKYLLPNGMYCWQDDSLPGIAYMAGRQFSAPTLLDTGNPLVWVDDTTFFKTNYNYMLPGSSLRLSVGNVSGNTTTVSHQYSGLDYAEGNALPAKNSFGIQFFFENDVMIDQQQGIISVRKKENRPKF